MLFFCVPDPSQILNGHIPTGNFFGVVSYQTLSKSFCVPDPYQNQTGHIPKGNFFERN